MEDVCYWLIQCPTWDHLRQPLSRELGVRDVNREADVKKQTAIVFCL